MKESHKAFHGKNTKEGFFNGKKEVYKVGSLTEGKMNIIVSLIKEYGIETADTVQDTLKDLLSGIITGIIEAEMDNHAGYEKHERNDSDNARNVKKPKRVSRNYGFKYSDRFFSNVLDTILQGLEI